MDQFAFERYVLNLLFIALEPFAAGTPGWSTVPLKSLLNEPSLALFYGLAEGLFARLLVVNSAQRSAWRTRGGGLPSGLRAIANDKLPTNL